jgi:hypothetical protein
VLALALAVPGAASAASMASPPPSYAGRTAQGIRVELRALSHGRWRFRYRARLNCSDGSVFLDRYFTDAVEITRGRFASRFGSNRGAVVTSVAGRVKGNRSRGSIRIVERYSEVPDTHGDTPLDPAGDIVCDSGLVSWQAAARPA